MVACQAGDVLCRHDQPDICRPGCRSIFRTPGQDAFRAPEDFVSLCFAEDIGLTDGERQAIPQMQAENRMQRRKLT